LNKTISQKIPWPRIFAESAIIVASILLALWVDAWWDTRQQSIEEVAILKPLREEALEVQQAIAENRTYTREILAATTKLANLTLEGTTEDQKDEIHRLIADFIWHVEPSSTDAPVLESLFYTGDLELISSSELRREISQVRTRLSGLRSEVLRDSNFYNLRIIPYLQQNTDMAQFYTVPSSQPGFPDRTYVYEGLLSSPVKSQLELLGKTEFQNLVLHRLTTLINALWWHDYELDERLERIVSLIDQEIGE